MSKTKEEKRTKIDNKTEANKGNTDATDPCSRTRKRRNGRVCVFACYVCVWDGMVEVDLFESEIEGKPEKVTS